MQMFTTSRVGLPPLDFLRQKCMNTSYKKLHHSNSCDNA